MTISKLSPSFVDNDMPQLHLFTKEIIFCALAVVVQWIEHQPVNQRVTSLIPSQGTCLGCGPGPQ